MNANGGSELSANSCEPCRTKSDDSEPIGPHLRRESPTPMRAKEKRERAGDDTLLICATCGEDLNDHGYVTMSGKNYCATPSCGYDPMLNAT